MPALLAIASPLVLISGANGYIAMHIIRGLLESSYCVRGTVRSESMIAHLQKTFEAFGHKLDIVVVANITRDGAFDGAVTGVDAVIHTASPFLDRIDDPQEVIEPAVDGTNSLLKSILQHGSLVKRVVVLSSTSAVLHVDRYEPQKFTEADWNDYAIKVVQEQGRNADSIVKYAASKTLAEKAAWMFWKEHKATVSWDLVVINPPYVFGPTLQDVEEPKKLNTSMFHLWLAVVQGAFDAPKLSEGFEWMDVRDVSKAHRLALEKEAAGGQRIIVSAAPYKWQDFLDSANLIQPPPYSNLPKGESSAGKEGAVHFLTFDTSKAARILGMGKDVPYTTLQQMMQDTIADFVKRGWKP